MLQIPPNSTASCSVSSFLSHPITFDLIVTKDYSFPICQISDVLHSDHHFLNRKTTSSGSLIPAIILPVHPPKFWRFNSLTGSPSLTSYIPKVSAMSVFMLYPLVLFPSFSPLPLSFLHSAKSQSHLQRLHLQ